MWSQPFTYLVTHLHNYAKSVSQNPSLSLSNNWRNPQKKHEIHHQNRKSTPPKPILPPQLKHNCWTTDYRNSTAGRKPQHHLFLLSFSCELPGTKWDSRDSRDMRLCRMNTLRSFYHL